MRNKKYLNIGKIVYMYNKTLDRLDSSTLNFRQNARSALVMPGTSPARTHFDYDNQQSKKDTLFSLYDPRTKYLESLEKELETRPTIV